MFSKGLILFRSEKGQEHLNNVYFKILLTEYSFYKILMLQ